ncbi:MAG TPA: hypothetical protein VGZ22_14430, partial [Isosphaeraceae bacterium]|nr:hypothetical protein [Isosphaeraceae bacterium]
MSNIKIQLDLGRVDFSSLVTDDDFRLEAQRLLPAAIKKVGDGVGKVAWDKLQKAFRGPAFKPTSSVADKKKFI